MATSLEDRFQSFLDSFPDAERIPHVRPYVKEGEKQADYILFGGKVVVEIKTLKASQQHKGESVVDEYLQERRVHIFGTLPLSRIAKDEQHLSALEATISKRMTRGIERICRSANRQIGDEFRRLPQLSTGLLVLINEDIVDLHPRHVADRVLEYVTTKPTNIHYCFLVFESHKTLINGKLLPYPLLLDLCYSFRQRRAKPMLQNLQNLWAQQNGFPNGLPNPEPMIIEYQPESVTLGG